VTRPGSGSAREKTKLTTEAHLTERREGGSQLRRHEPKGKTYFRKYAIDARASWFDKHGFSLREERGQWSRLGQTPSGPVRLAGPKAKKKNFFTKNLIFEFTKALEICTRRFRRNFDMRIFPKFF
jgi:hypothetical protein